MYIPIFLEHYRQLINSGSLDEQEGPPREAANISGVDDETVGGGEHERSSGEHENTGGGKDVVEKAKKHVTMKESPNVK